ncbi:hypothetical protein PILCRDRAFT_15440 [Piloderma croceum F 1598]|uniref:Chromo domain-containing protein n=1 Tax=Piloderma croceum (strain F 1598) TaxID=765440 RepID=A0A0C3AHB8_PILCF|nr:hypothetical protein PILCRDRAFT_15440 [Piloderma croceum F 1598]
MGKEYEIDFISQAEVFGGAYRRYWHYTVHWKGYGAEESTQEPLKSFQPTSTNKKSAVPIVEAFWKSLNYDEIPKASAFEKGHIEGKKGPPKRKREAWSEGSSEFPTKDPSGRWCNPRLEPQCRAFPNFRSDCK